MHRDATVKERGVDLRRSPLPHGRGSVRRRGFTIIELIVSIGLLALMMSLAGKVFSISVASTGQATALIEVSQSFRLLGATLRDDLRSINPERSMLVIAANPINAYWTAEGRELDSPANGGDSDPSSGYLHDLDAERQYTNGDMVPPRADVLMTFTSRKAHSVRYPSIWSNIVQVVYGHAELGELAGGGNWVAGVGPNDFGTHDPTIGIAFPTPASEWHLARRSVLIVDAAEASLGVSGLGRAPDEGTSEPYPLSNGDVDVITLRDTGSFDYEQEVARGEIANNPDPAVLQRWYRRSRMDVTPPAQLAHRLAHYFLPKCASFKVEWTPIGSGRAPKYGGIKLEEMLWIDPGAAAGGAPDDWVAKIVAIQSRMQPGDPRIADLNNLLGSLNTRFGGATTHEWFAIDPVTGAEGDPFWPTALRITVDVYDDVGRLSRPTRHVFILPIGEG